MNTNDPTLEQLAAGPIDEIDERLLAEIARLYDALDPMPSGLEDRIKFGITLDALHAEVAQLQRLGAADLVGARSDVTDAETITFSTSTLTTMVTITPTGADRVRVDGWIAPGADVVVELRVTDDVLSTTADADGRFVIENAPRGFAQFVLRPPGSDSAVITPTMEL